MIGLIIPTVFILGIVMGITICSMFIEYEEKDDIDNEYLKDIIYYTTQYLPISDKEIAILNDKLFKAISKRVGGKLCK